MTDQHVERTTIDLTTLSDVEPDTHAAAGISDPVQEVPAAAQSQSILSYCHVHVPHGCSAAMLWLYKDAASLDRFVHHRQ